MRRRWQPAPIDPDAEDRWRASKDLERHEFEDRLDLDRHKPVRTQEQICSDMEMDRQAARNGLNPNP